MCETILERPVLLPCGEIICTRHEKQYKSKDTAKCQLCDGEHFLDESQHFLTNKVAAGLLAAEFNKLDFGENYKQAAKLLAELKSAYLDYEKFQDNAEELIFGTFQEMRRKVNLTREEIIQHL